ncbi:MAG TPA: PKD domain-containing protein [Vicinamibacterales bacterium]|jgi:PKD repeat protein|nr:PKD domain-containing protein [Vicinamibacterales bacterium]
MRKLLVAAPLFAALALACQSKAPVGPGVVTITETTTSTTTTTTSTMPAPTVAAFTFSPVTPEVLQVVNFNASTSMPGTNRTIVSYSWDFGDGESKTGVTTTHDYVISGVYLVTLTVVDDAGQKASTSQPVTVRPHIP